MSAQAPDHEPDPVPVSTLETVTRRCDFCGDPRPVWTLTGGDVTAIALDETSGLLQDFGDRWAACAACMVDIGHRKTERIVDRAITHPDLRDDPHVRDEIRRLHLAFFRELAPGRTLVITTAWPATPLQPRDLPKIRDRLARLYRGPDSLPPPFDMPRTRTGLADELDRSTLYWIDPDFTDLTTHATGQLPDTTAGATHPPATTGLLVWARPVPPHDTVAVSWIATPDSCRLTRYRSIGGGLEGLPLQRLREDVGWLVPVRTTDLTPQDPISAGTPHAALIATWLLIDQKLAEEQPAPLDPATRKAYARAGRPTPDVRVVRIRGHTPQGARAASTGVRTYGYKDGSGSPDTGATSPTAPAERCAARSTSTRS